MLSPHPKSSFSGLVRLNRLLRNSRLSFTSAPELTVHDCGWQFVVEVDASDVGIGAVLSQSVSQTENLEKEITTWGNMSCWPIGMTLKEWNHGLEGTEKSFLV